MDISFEFVCIHLISLGRFLTMQAHKQLQGEEKPHKPFLQFTSLELRKLMIKGKVADIGYILSIRIFQFLKQYSFDTG